MTDEVELKDSTGSDAGSETGSETKSETGSNLQPVSKTAIEEKPEAEAEKEKLLEDKDKYEKTSDDQANEDLEENNPAKYEDSEDDNENIPFYKSLWFIILMSGKLWTMNRSCQQTGQFYATNTIWSMSYDHIESYSLYDIGHMTHMISILYF